MRRFALIPITLILIWGCSGNKGTNSGPDSTGLNISTDRMSFAQAATDDRHPSSPLVLSNQGSDTLVLSYQSESSWLKISHDSCSLIPKQSDTLSIHIEGDTIRAGNYTGRVVVNNSKSPGSPHYLAVTLAVRPETTWIHLESPSSSWVYDGYNSSCYKYTVTSGWMMRCFSNAGKSVQVFQYSATGVGELGHDKVTDILMTSGQMMPGSITFDGCAGGPPPPRGSWTVAVGYRYGGKEFWVYGDYEL